MNLIGRSEVPHYTAACAAAQQLAQQAASRHHERHVRVLCTARYQPSGARSRHCGTAGCIHAHRHQLHSVLLAVAAGWYAQGAAAVVRLMQRSSRAAASLHVRCKHGLPRQPARCNSCTAGGMRKRLVGSLHAVTGLRSLGTGDGKDVLSYFTLML